MYLDGVRTIVNGGSLEHHPAVAEVKTSSGMIEGSIIGVTMGDARKLDYSLDAVGAMVNAGGSLAYTI